MHVHRGHIMLGTADRLCPHRWRIWTADGRYLTTTSSLQSSIDTLATEQPQASRQLR